MIEKIIRFVKSNRSAILIITVVWAVVSILAGGWIYYNFCYPLDRGKCMVLSLQNLFETLLFNPVVTIEKMAEKTGFLVNLSSVKSFIIYSFCAAAILVPAIDLFVVYNIANRFLHIVLSNPLATKRHLLIVGYNPQVINLLKSSKNDFKVFLWSEKSLTNEEKIELTRLKVHANTNESPLGAQARTDELKKRFNHFLSNKSIENVLLMQESDTVNIEYYMLLSSCDACRERNIHFYVKIDHFASKLTLQEYFDHQLSIEKEKKDLDKGYQPLKMDLRIFNLPMIQAEEIYQLFPMFKGTNEKKGYKVHLMIAGDNALAYEMMLNAMNQAVITDSNTILIDVYGKNIEALRSRLNKRFNFKYVECTDDTYEILPDHADGSLSIRLLEADLSKDESINIVKKNCKEDPYTYFICCLENPDENLHCFRQLKDTFGSIPMVFRMPYTRQMKAYLNREITRKETVTVPLNNTPSLPWSTTGNVYLMGSDIEYLKLGNIIDLQEEKKIRDFNLKYLDIMGKSTKDANTDWNSIAYYQRQSNRFLYNHLHNKLFVALNETYDFEKAVEEYWKEEVDGSTDLEPSGKETDEKIIDTVEKTVVNGKNEEASKKAAEENLKEEVGGSTDAEPSGKKTDEKITDTVKKPAVNRENKEAEKSKQLCSSELISFAKTEHRRFCYAYASEGWGYTPGKKKEDKLLHDCLCTWDVLMEKDSTKNKLVYDATSAREVRNRYHKYKPSIKSHEQRETCTEIER